MFLYTIQESLNEIKNYVDGVVENIKSTISNDKTTDENSYNLDITIQKIQSAVQNNQKICLFIGRCAIEPLPVEAGSTWVSGDIHLGSPPFDLNRIHLLRDFTDEKQLEPIQNLFDKIVIDQSTCKCMRGDFISRFVKLLKKSTTSQLIFERTPYMITYPPNSMAIVNRYSGMECPLHLLIEDSKRSSAILDLYRKQTDQKTKDTDLEEFEKQKTGAKGSPFYVTFQGYITNKIRKETGEPELSGRLITNAQEDTENHTRTLFKNVEVHKESTYPYPTNYSIPGKDSFIVATGVK